MEHKPREKTRARENESNGRVEARTGGKGKGRREEEINVLDHLVLPAVMKHLGNKEKLCGKGNGTSSVLTRGLGVKIGRGKVRVPSWFSISA